MSTLLTRRGVLAGAIALPWLVSCGTSTSTDPDKATSPRTQSPASPHSGTQASPHPGTQTPPSPRTGTRASPHTGTQAPPRPTVPAPNSPAGVDLAEGVFFSRFWPGKKVRWRLGEPTHQGSGGAAPPLVIALHGHGGGASWAFDGAHLERYIHATGLAVAAVDGGNFYWHARRSGVDTGALVLHDFLPLLSRQGLNTDRLALIGWSMGGFGALLLASRLGPRRVTAVVAVSAALWESAPPSTAPGSAFDGPLDFARNDVFRRRRALAGIPIRLDCGLDDSFILANRALAGELPSAVATFDPGRHSKAYWRAHAGAEMRWLRKRF